MNDVTATAMESTPAKAPDGLIEVRVTAIRYAARDTHLYEFTRPDGKPLPAYEPGAHIDLHLPNGLIRQYSLINAEPDPATYTVGIKRDPASRGGSRYVHDELRVGKTLKISAPRNNFALVESAKPRRAVRRRHRHHADLVHGAAAGTSSAAPGRSITPAARAPTWPSCNRSKRWLPAQFHFDDESAGKFLDVASIIAETPKDAHLYCCGPTPMLKAFEAATADWPREQVHVEYFTPKPQETDKKGGFVVELARSGQEFVIPEGKSILQVLLDAGVDVDYSCELGICGACEQRVISGDARAPRRHPHRGGAGLQHQGHDLLRRLQERPAGAGPLIRQHALARNPATRKRSRPGTRPGRSICCAPPY